MLVVGLCGGIGAGKSTVASLLAARGARVIDVDAIGRDVLTLDDVRDQVREAFGDEVLAADGSIDRTALAGLVFSGDGRLADLEAISHPAINEELAHQLDELATDAPPLVVLDMAVLVESTLGQPGQIPGRRGYTQVVVVEADTEVRLARLVDRGMSTADARARMASQATDIERRAVADHVLTNNRDEATLEHQVDDLWKVLTG
ncbi:MAG: dephospho-CoA kinase [Actinobacteria bacterium]|nr:dephospho-CoA kinase [Actinomycetota bacterium]